MVCLGLWCPNKHSHPLISQVIGQVWREVVGCRNWPVMRVPLFIALRRNEGCKWLRTQWENEMSKADKFLECGFKTRYIKIKNIINHEVTCIFGMVSFNKSLDHFPCVGLIISRLLSELTVILKHSTSYLTTNDNYGCVVNCITVLHHFQVEPC